MQYYKIRQDGFKEIKNQSLIKSVPLMLIALTFGIIIGSMNLKQQPSDVNIWPIVIPIVVIAASVGIYRGINRQRGLFDSYQLTLTNNLITREQFNTPTVSIYFNEVKEIIQNKNGSFTIYGKDSSDIIAIPVQIDKYLELQNSLNQIKPISTKSTKSFFQNYSSVITIFTLGLMLCVYTVTNKIIVSVSGTIVVAILSWSFYEVRKSKNIDAKTKRSMRWGLMVIASVIGVVILKLFGLTKS